jgi:hypothetical protein
MARLSNRLERLHGLLSRLYGRAGQAQGAPKLHVLLQSAQGPVDALGLREAGSPEGPFIAPYANQRLDVPGVDGGWIVMARKDQILDLETTKARDKFCEEQADGTQDDCIGTQTPLMQPVVRTWESVLYSAFAQHFLIQCARGLSALVSGRDRRAVFHHGHAQGRVDQLCAGPRLSQTGAAILWRCECQGGVDRAISFGARHAHGMDALSRVADHAFLVFSNRNPR